MCWRRRGKSSIKPFVLYTSTNKVYGALESVPVVAEGTRYRARDPLFCGVNESSVPGFPFALWLFERHGGPVRA